jgi:hypothetical protein
MGSPWFWIGLYLLGIVGLWRIFSKAGEAGWKAIVPIWSIVVLLRIVGRPRWWLVLFLIPLVDVVAGIVVSLDLARCFGRGEGFGAGLAIVPALFWILLGFNSDRYEGRLAGTPLARHTDVCW